MSIIKDEFIVYQPRYINGRRVCDGPACSYIGHLNKINNNLGYPILLCNYHLKLPYDVYGENKYNLPEPNFNIDSYKILIDNKIIICGYKGCDKYDNLLKIHSDYFCSKHAKEITALTLSYINKDNPIQMLINLIKEFNYRKVLYPKNILEIKRIEEEMNLNRDVYSKSQINRIHYHYAYNNLNIIETLNNKKKEVVSAPISPVVKPRFAENNKILISSTPVYKPGSVRDILMNKNLSTHTYFSIDPIDFLKNPVYKY